MSMDNLVSFEELEHRRRRASNARKASQCPKAPPPVHTDSEALAVINEIFNPSLKIPETKGRYTLPDEMRADDSGAAKDLDIEKLAELKEVFLLFDTDSDGLISKDDLRFTYIALGTDVSDEQLQDMLNEAKDPLNYEAFVDLITRRTVELDSEDVLLEAWSKWDTNGTGKIEEKSCLDYIELFPYLRESVIENSTSPEYVFCNHQNASAASNKTAVAATASKAPALVDIGDEFIYSAGKVFGIRVRFRKQEKSEVTADASNLNITGAYRFLKKTNFKNDGRLIPGSYCDYYFFADANAAAPKTFDIWQYFHSPRFPAKYPAHIKCAYKFIGRPESRVEIIFEELHIPKQGASCNMDKLTIFDSESANMNAVIDVVCDALPTRRIISSGPDLLIEFNASSNVTAKGFRGKFKFLHNAVEANATATTPSSTAEAIVGMEKIATKKLIVTDGKADWGKSYKDNENCKHIFDSRVNKSGRFESSQLFALSAPSAANVNIIAAHATLGSRGPPQCRWEFYGEADERVQIKFLDFNIPAESKNSSDCRPTESLQLLTQVRGKYEAADLFCGAFLPKPIMSKGPKLLLQFVGKYPAPNNKVTYYGFKAEYKFVNNFGITTGNQIDNNCTFIYNSTERKSGWFGSPNYPGYYPQNIICNYFFYGESEEKVIIRFTYFDVEGIGTCEYLTASDYVEFSNFMSTDRKYPKYCGKRNKFEIRSDGKFFRVAFYSNDRFDKTGFRALYDFEDKHLRVENTSVQSYVSASNIITIPVIIHVIFVKILFLKCILM